MAIITQGAKEIIQGFVNTLTDSPDLFDFFIEECKRAKIYSPSKPTYKTRFEHYKAMKKLSIKDKETPEKDLTLPNISLKQIESPYEGNLSAIINSTNETIQKRYESQLPKIVEAKIIAIKKKPLKYLRSSETESMQSQSRMLSTRAKNSAITETSDEIAAAVKYNDKNFKEHFKALCLKEGVKTFKNIITNETFSYHLSKKYGEKIGAVIANQFQLEDGLSCEGFAKLLQQCLSNKDKLKRLGFRIIMLEERKRSVITEKDVCKFLLETEKLKFADDEEKTVFHTEAIVELEKNKRQIIEAEKKRQQNAPNNDDRKGIFNAAVQEIDDKKKVHENAIQEIEDRIRFHDASIQDMLILSNQLAIITKSNEGRNIAKEVDYGRSRVLSLFKDKLQIKLKEKLHWEKLKKEDYVGITYSDFKRTKFEQDIPSIVHEVMLYISQYRLKKDIEVRSCTASDSEENSGLKDEIIFLNLVEKHGPETKQLFEMFRKLSRNPHRPPDKCYITHKYMIKNFQSVFGYDFPLLAKRLFQFIHKKEKKTFYPQRVYFNSFLSAVESLVSVYK